MAVKFIIDSAGDMIPAECEKLSVTHLPLTVRFGEEEYADAVTLSHGDFYTKLTTNPNHPTTSQVTPAVFADAYERLAEQGHEVVVITLSSRLSGTYQSAVIASEDFEGRVFVVDSLSATAGEQVLLRRGLELAEQGLSAEAIAETLEEEKSRIRLFAVVDTLEYLKKGGRISAATAVVGGMLNIKPLIAVRDGLVESVGKARGQKAANNQLRQLVEKTKGIDPAMPAMVVWSGSSDENLRRFMEDHGDLWGEKEMGIGTVGCVIGAHVGPGAFGVIYFEKE
ncbi:MAG: DegV family protein [Oscillospiraceae bacterium]|nr:DegV family protein [Oscillospiraceae bacterium]